jgi:murein L,D-transpeptidase YafK
MKKWTLRIFLLLITAALAYYVYPEAALPPNTKIDSLIVIKGKRIMKAYSQGHLVKTYKISIGQNPWGDKQSEGDKRTPEGEYTINDRNARSGYHKNLGVSYPNKADKEEAVKKGLNPGGEIKIHGLRNGLGFLGKFHRIFNWTAGCIAVTNTEIDELYSAVGMGTPIVINP